MPSTRQVVIGALIVGAGIAIVFALRTGDSRPEAVPGAVSSGTSEAQPEPPKHADPIATELESPLVDGRSDAASSTPKAEDRAFHQRKTLADNLPKLSEAGMTLTSVPVRIVMFQSIALALDAQGRGIPQSNGENAKPKPGQNNFMYSGFVYLFEPGEFPEFDAFMRNRRSGGGLPESEVKDVIELIRQRGEAALASLSAPPK